MSANNEQDDDRTPVYGCEFAASDLTGRMTGMNRLRARTAASAGWGRQPLTRTTNQRTSRPATAPSRTRGELCERTSIV
jgi:hypothetical protein